MPYTVATDGACMRNPGPTGWAWVGEDGRWAAGSHTAGTNNVGELLALLHAIQDHEHIEHLIIQADSLYAINTYEKWMYGHRGRGWTTAAGKPVSNRDILEDLIVAKERRHALGLPDAVLEHVKGHAGHRLNGWADERAVRASHHGSRGIARIWGSESGGELIDTTTDAPAAAGDKVLKRAKPRRRRA